MHACMYTNNFFLLYTTPNPQILKREKVEKDQSKKKKKLVSVEKSKKTRRKKQSEKKDGMKQLSVKEMIQKLEGEGARSGGRKIQRNRSCAATKEEV